jgi:hypothetical protein
VVIATPGPGQVLVDVVVEAAQAHADIESRRTTGNLLLIPDRAR